MSNRPVRFRGTEYPVIERFRIGRRDYLAVAKIGSVGRRAYKVYDPAARQMRALHVLSESDGTLRRVQTLQRLTSGDNEILQILDYGRAQGSIRVVVPWIDGFNLRSVLSGIRDQGRPRIATPEAVRLVKGVAHALRHLHRHRQIIHGDIKPANLILTKRTSLVLIDYGNAWTIERTTTRHAGDGLSHVYAAPEVIRGERSVNFRADCFSLGVVLYEILTGRLPYDGQGGNAGMLPVRSRSGLRLVPSSELSPERDQISRRVWRPIDALLEKSLAIDADDRFDTSAKWLDAWSAIMAEIRNIGQRPRIPNMLVRFMDWSAGRFG